MGVTALKTCLLAVFSIGRVIYDWNLKSKTNRWNPVGFNSTNFDFILNTFYNFIRFNLDSGFLKYIKEINNFFKF